MKINLSDIDTTNFVIKNGNINGIGCVLIHPVHIGCKWTQRNKIFRSSIWDLNGNPLSLSFPKFVNMGENPEHFPAPTNLNNAIVVDKIDGSTFVASLINNKLNVRTRGTFSYEALENAEDFQYCINQYPLIEDFLRQCDSEITLLFEIVTPNCKIVLDYGDNPDLFLIGAIHHDTYRLMTQKCLDVAAQSIGVKRPKYYNYQSLEELTNSILCSKNIEGCCVYTKNDQEIHKLKSDWYLKLHKLKSELGSLERVVDFYFENERPHFNTFYQIVADTLDYEIAEQSRGSISLICDGMKEVDKIIVGMKNFIDKNNLHGILRKEAAQKILQAYGNTNRASFVFLLLDGRELQKEHYKKLLWQVLKK